VCDPDSDACGAGRRCNINSGLCEDDTGGPGPGPGGDITCTTGSLGGACAPGDVCVGGNACEAPCTSQTMCVSSEQICELDASRASFNTCVDPDTTAACMQGCFATCPERGNHQRDAGGPIIFDILFTGDLGSTASCGAPAVAQRFTMDVYSPAGLSTSNVFTEVLRRLDSGNEQGVFSEGPGSNTHPTVMSQGNGIYQVTFYLCDDPSSSTIFSVFVRDTANRDSNAICFRPSAM
jgi:hypothetical protein